MKSVLNILCIACIPLKKKQGKFYLFYCPCTGSRIRADHEYLGSQNNVCQTQKSNGIGLRKSVYTDSIIVKL